MHALSPAHRTLDPIVDRSRQLFCARLQQRAAARGHGEAGDLSVTALLLPLRVVCHWGVLQRLLHFVQAVKVGMGAEISPNPPPPKAKETKGQIEKELDPPLVNVRVLLHGPRLVLPLPDEAKQQRPMAVVVQVGDMRVTSEEALVADDNEVPSASR